MACWRLGPSEERRSGFIETRSANLDKNPTTNMKEGAEISVEKKTGAVVKS